jgi:2-hydroxychromene-2-carboxylate isomerase
MFLAMWADGENLGDPEVCTRVLGEAGVDAQALFAAAGTEDVKQALRATTDEAIERGAFGAPTFLVGDEMFFGNDRLDFVERALESEEAPA